MIATSATDKRIIVWRLQVIDFFAEAENCAMFDEPVVEIMFSVGPPAPQKPLPGQQQLSRPGAPDSAANLLDQQANQIYYPNVLRLKWNMTGTCFAGSAEDGTVSVWQRSIQNSMKFVKIAGIKSRS